MLNLVRYCKITNSNKQVCGRSFYRLTSGYNIAKKKQNNKTKSNNPKISICK